MDATIEKILNLFKELAFRLGTKCTVAIAALAALGYGVYAAIIPPMLGVPAIVAVVGLYFLFDYLYKKGVPNATTTNRPAGNNGNGQH